MSENILTITNFTQKYNSKIAVNDLTLEVKQGEIYGFIGHNGAGKSTTIKSIVGILPIELGEILIDGHSLKQERRICQSMCAYVPDNPDLYEYMTGVEYINFVADLYDTPEELRKEWIPYYAKRFDIAAQLGDLISSYSHGMKQKVALIAAFAHRPKLLVLDEPFVGLDPKASATLKQCMHELCESKSSIFFSTHVLEVAQVLCDRIAMMDHGNLILEGKVNELTSAQSLEELFLTELAKKEAQLL